MTRANFAALLAGMASSGLVFAAYALATHPEPGWVCADFQNEIMADAVRSGRSFQWIDPQGVPHKVGAVDGDWYCVQSEFNARQLVRPYGTDAEAFK